jgi:soluble lytic murein transglycosylase-like protein
MKKLGALAVAFAAGLQPFAADSMEMPSAMRIAMQTVQKTASTVDALNDATLDAQTRIGFPAKPGDRLSAAYGKAYGAIIARYAGENGVPIALAHAVIEIESRYRPNARGSAGEVGLMQIKPATARSMGYRGSTAGLYLPETNIRFGMKYLGIAHRLGGGATCQTILKYNAGHAAKRMNPVSRAYCGKVKRELAS